MNTRTRVIILPILFILFAPFNLLAQDGRIVRETIYSPSLERNLLDDSPDRRVTIYLPPSYDDNPEMAYPVVYLLHGYTANNEVWTGGLAGNVLYSMRSWLKNGKVKEMILVMPNSYNKFQGSNYTNSITMGNWADYIARDLVDYIDSNYRTLPQRESRGVIGHSMGGYGGMNLGMNYPDVFNCMGSMSGMLDISQYPGRISWSFAQAAKLKNLSDFYSQPFDVQVAIAMSAAFCPNPDRLPFYADFPWERDASNKLVKNEEVWDRFMEHDILTRLEENAAALLNMGAIYIDCGTSDEFNFLVDLRRTHDELQRLGISHHYREFSGTHTCCVNASTGEALEVFSNAMAFETLLGVEPAGMLAITWGQLKAYSIQ